MCPAAHPSAPAEILIPIGPASLAADLVIPAGARGLVLFAHGSGSSRFSSRNRFVASAMNQARFGTVLADLLTPEEEREDLRTSQLRFDIGLLASRVEAIAGWLQTSNATNRLPLGLFGASTGAAAALDAAAERPGLVRAVVSRGGRPDLATRLTGVRAATLLIVGGHDPTVLELNREAVRELTCVKRLDIVPGATHLFEEPGCLERVAALARDWFVEYLTVPAPRRTA